MVCFVAGAVAAGATATVFDGDASDPAALPPSSLNNCFFAQGQQSERISVFPFKWSPWRSFVFLHTTQRQTASPVTVSVAAGFVSAAEAGVVLVVAGAWKPKAFCGPEPNTDGGDPLPAGDWVLAAAGVGANGLTFGGVAAEGTWTGEVAAVGLAVKADDPKKP
jgi:hypothetical protein